jgi:peptide deformylase
MLREILIWPDPRLREKGEPIGKVDEEIRDLVADMFETMYAARGVGLAATQVGIRKQLAVIDTSPRQEGAKPMVLINPVLTHTEGETVNEEACLSIPGEAEEVKRFEKVTVEALDLEGRPFTLSAEGFLAIALQHEVDHLQGLLFVDHLSALKRELIKRRMKRVKAEREEEKRRRAEEELPPTL